MAESAPARRDSRPAYRRLCSRCRTISSTIRIGWFGWAWGGSQPIERVEITTDDGRSWHDAVLDKPDGYFPDAPLPAEAREHAWTVFHWVWRSPEPGTYRIASRAHAVDGTVQRMEEDPDVKGHFDQTRVKWRRVKVPR